MFEEDGGTAGDACQRALDAAQTALASVHSGALDDDSIRFGIALHYGDAAYGNVGSGDRLDFTVVGRDVNVAARISALCSALGRPLLASAEFVAQVVPAFHSCGAHPAHGLDGLLEVFEPIETVAVAVAV
ncbi:adenylate/guanylate cyclase domain-containing protein [Segnochrobactrum spirostomi]|uniref:adenylate/guanylate cyclase domain-containing protein n=1 Tax=Segnochrobactrum spirostomi TaxID=2608987 RepID=UPI001AD8353A|nr:adenylate/guanylate cyclase domain-containing protein [Segnochrobactrum spirostomi]